MKSLHMLALALPALALAGCGGGGSGQNVTTAAENFEEALSGGANAAGNAFTDLTTTSGQEFADTIAASDAYEVEAGKLARVKATSKALKDFGAMMVTDHGKSTADLKAAAGKVDPAIIPAATLTVEQTANLDALRAATGEDFDAAYRSQQDAAHRKALGVLQSYAANGTVPELKEFAAKAVPVVQGHLTHIAGTKP